MSDILSSFHCYKMNDTLFWKIISAAWSEAGGYESEREALSAGNLSEDDLEELNGGLEEFLEALTDALQRLGQKELLAFDQILERKLYEIDREEIQEFTDAAIKRVDESLKTKEQEIMQV